MELDNDAQLKKRTFRVKFKRVRYVPKADIASAIIQFGNLIRNHKCRINISRFSRRRLIQISNGSNTSTIISGRNTHN